MVDYFIGYNSIWCMEYREPHYQIAQICVNGHVVKSTLESIQEAEGKYCRRCGMQTITECQNCKSPIQGELYNPYVTVIASFQAPPFCIHCGKPFPWTESGLRAAKEYAEELQNKFAGFIEGIYKVYFQTETNVFLLQIHLGLRRF